jgi:hypothetical protein
MPNECVNYITIKFKSQNERQDFEMDFMNNHRGLNKKIIKKGSTGIIVRFNVPSEPDIEFLQCILQKHPDCWIRNDWNNESGIAGVWVGYWEGEAKVIDEMKWNDLSVDDLIHCFET